MLSTLLSNTVQCAVTSPPFYGLRDYGATGQLGLEASPTEYVQNLREVFSEVRRVLRPDGVLFLNLGDSYSTPRLTQSRRAIGLPEKNLLLMPSRVAIALQDDGWIVRNAVVWEKTNCKPESVSDRFASRYEMVYMFSKSKRYKFDLDPVRARVNPKSLGTSSGTRPARQSLVPGNSWAEFRPGQRTVDFHSLGRNPGDVWRLPVSRYRGGHFATFPPALAERCILAGSAVGDLILDPFIGAGTTLAVAKQLERAGIGIDINPEFIELARARVAEGVALPLRARTVCRQCGAPIGSQRKTSTTYCSNRCRQRSYRERNELRSTDSAVSS